MRRARRGTGRRWRRHGDAWSRVPRPRSSASSSSRVGGATRPCPGASGSALPSFVAAGPLRSLSSSPAPPPDLFSSASRHRRRRRTRRAAEGGGYAAWQGAWGRLKESHAQRHAGARGGVAPQVEAGTGKEGEGEEVMCQIVIGLEK
ncbi:hypothetical protein U9M48_035142 [Paspalum notatum var. saurae]|uniref:Uncharacterized protein n=1 Tax=Paspalum notatum var. saurae TaxID=547442 RepID=A0AAQ3X8P0_PASNO